MLDIDVRLLSILQEISRTRNVSLAAQNIGLSQPTVSIALRKLRQRFGDPLFVRTSGGMQPTPFAVEVLESVEKALRLLADGLEHRMAFDPRKSSHQFRISMTDISQIVLLPRLLNHLKGAAPSIRIEVADISDATPRHLESGEADLAIGFMPQLHAGYFQQRLFPQRFVCMVRGDHPRIRHSLDRSQFVAESHVQVLARATGHGVVDRVLAEKGIQRKIALRVPNFLGIGLIVMNTDLVAIIPQRLAKTFMREFDVRILEPPIDFPKYAVRQHWHRRFHHDPRNKWMRGVVARLFSEPPHRAAAEDAAS
jgi:DNA-binding transcriptional LysR family regulator